MNRLVYQAVRVEYANQPTLKISIDGNSVTNMERFTLPNHSTFRGRRITFPVSVNGYVPHIEVVPSTQGGTSYQSLLQNENFETVPIENFNQQQLFHYYDIGVRGDGVNSGTLSVYLDGVAQTQEASPVTYTPANDTETIRAYFNALAYGYIPHIHSSGSTAVDFEILWARPVALPPRFYRGIRTHSEFQITYKGDVQIEWYLDGVSVGTYNFNSSNTVTEKAYFPSGTIGQVLQYIHENPQAGGKIYMIETDITLADLEQQAMRPQAEEG